MFYIAICDDEKYYREEIKSQVKNYLMKYQIESQIELFKSGTEICEKEIDLAKYHIIFLDINMGEMDGIQTAKRIRTVNSEVSIVFVTAFVNYVFDGYKVGAERYIMKDILEASVIECMDHIIEKMKIETRKITISFIEGNKHILVDRILYVESKQHKLIFYILEPQITQYTIYTKLDNMEEQLNDFDFLRIHKSYLVNMKHIETISGYKAFLSSGEVLPVPKLKYQAVKERFTEYKGVI